MASSKSFIVRINGHDQVAPAILASGQIFGPHRGAHQARFLQNSLGKVERQIVLAQNG
jgi:hypothetical protein